jgi:hypothetical protein
MTTRPIAPEFTTRGLMLPWPLVVTISISLIVCCIVPLWLGAIHAMNVSQRVDSVVVNDARQDQTLIKHGERIARVEERAK